tara:strand:+ start:372 stop:584 length:213 start_codon:yes stop_codon:yes gene_type:complete
MKKVYVDTSDTAEAKREKLDDNVTIAYDLHGDIVGVEITNPTGIDIDDKTMVDYVTVEDEFNPNERWAFA